jgi:hypothetical protein
MTAGIQEPGQRVKLLPKRFASSQESLGEGMGEAKPSRLEDGVGRTAKLHVLLFLFHSSKHFHADLPYVVQQPQHE